MKELELAEVLKNYSAKYFKELKKLKEMQGKQATQVYATQGQRSRIRDSVHTQGEYVEYIIHEIHCVCVELSIAKREDWRYGDKITSTPIGVLNHDCRTYRRTPN